LANSSADVAIIGGGVIGWSCAWHLLRREPALRVVVIDPDPNRCTSLRGAGGCRAQFASRINIEISLVSIEEFKRFAECVGTDIKFRQHGYLLYTADAERATAMRNLASFQRSHGVPIEEISIDDLKCRVPCLNTNDLVYADIGRTSGYLDGPGVVRGYRTASVKMGAEELREKATALSPTSVETSEGEVQANHVVVATGHWSAGLGLDLPVKPEKHQLCFALPNKVDPTWPFIIDADTTYHFRPYGDGILVCYNDPKLASGRHNADDKPDFDPDALERMFEFAEQRTPGFLNKQNCSPGRAGFYGVTPDRHPIIGTLNNIVVAAGFGGHGVMHSPAAGLLVAELILDGKATTVDITSLSPDRFRKGKLIEESMVF
jgi:sarcosine oxidase subunit beta